MPCGRNGWRLEGVVDVELRPAGTKVDADDYFISINWKVAYRFDTAADMWVKSVPDTGGILETGAGYWVWVSRVSSVATYRSGGI